MSVPIEPTAAVIYARASLDRTNERASVERQLEAARQLATGRGLTVVGEFVDNDVSATAHRGRVRQRPGFDALMAEVATGSVGWIVATEFTRLSRNRRDELALIEACTSAGVSVALTRGQDLAFGSAMGRMVAELMASIARLEVETMAERQTAAHAQRAAKGKPHWTRRPLGFERDGQHRDAEAEVIREGYTAVIGGATASQVAREWNTSGAISPTNGGTTWRSGDVLRLLRNPRNAGIRAHKGVEVGEGTWEPIVDVETFRAAVTLMSGRGTPGPRAQVFLLTGLALCGVCLAEGREVTVHVGTQSKPHTDGTRRRTYRCSARPGHLSRSLAPIDERVRMVTLGVMLGAAASGSAEPSPTVVPLIAQLGQLQAEAEEWGRSAVGAGAAVRSAALAAIAELETRSEALEAQIADVRRSELTWAWAGGKLPNFDELGEIFDSWPLARRQAAVRDVLARVVIHGGWKPVEMVPRDPDAAVMVPAHLQPRAQRGARAKVVAAEGPVTVVREGQK
ncbi:recombinase family protein [Litorihabitans aurantiacus]|uniref:Recombinase family protein n=1 Tax=Litorihabitans aurantiacus TaxID=1930061 RepID=A0AA38CQX2_9MICO|nr:recombinase family protein [Litorihabitans aurantiacus]GMA32573.1 hypothetical protein GCM10025875_25650 [Litorihabitans aurantiacus]